MKTKLDIINETMEFYSADVSRRAMAADSYVCMYITSDGRKCAVGRCFDENKISQYTYDRIEGYSVNNLPITLDNLLKEEYKGHSSEFWNNLQGLHDHTNNWCETGLSLFGLSELNELKQKYAE